jgi:hypothetical protein
MHARQLVWIIAVTGCGNGTAPSTTPNEVEVARADAAAPPPEAPPPKPEVPARSIADGSVGDIVIGKPIPQVYLDQAPRYEARWVADAQPMEGFLIGEPPIWATFEGPMAKVEPGPLEDLLPKLAPKALEAARAGAPVDSILIERAGITTASGIGVGTPYAELEQKHGPVKLLRNPEEFDSNISCVASVDDFKQVRFYLESCKQNTPYGPVKRVLLHP